MVKIEAGGLLKMYEDFKNFTIEDAKERISKIVYEQELIQPTINFEQYERIVPVNLPGIKKMYSISDYGRVFNNKFGKELNQTTRNINTTWYKYVGLQREDNGRQIWAVHNIVAIHFIPRTEEDILLGRDCINHINCFKNDSRACNLQWVTKEENNWYAHIMHEYENIIAKPFMIQQNSKWGVGVQGASNGMATHTEDQVRAICNGLEKGYSYADCLYDAGLDLTNQNIRWLQSIESRRRWKSVSKDYNF